MRGDVPLGDLLREVNDSLCHNNKENLFITAFVAILDGKTNKLLYSNAGHEPPFILRKEGAERLDAAPNFVLGVVENMTYEVGEVDFFDGDSFFLYTDGLSEATDEEGKLFTKDRIGSRLTDLAGHAPKSLLAEMESAARVFCNGAPQADDLTMLAVKKRAKEFEKTLKDPVLSDITAVLDEVEAFLPQGTASTAKICSCCDELLNNVISYSGAKELTLKLAISDDCVMTLADDGTPFDATKAEVPDAEIGGNGIHIVRHFARSLTYDQTDGKNVLTAHFDL